MPLWQHLVNKPHSLRHSGPGITADLCSIKDLCTVLSPVSPSLLTLAQTFLSFRNLSVKKLPVPAVSSKYKIRKEAGNWPNY